MLDPDEEYERHSSYVPSAWSHLKFEGQKPGREFPNRCREHLHPKGGSQLRCVMEGEGKELAVEGPICRWNSSSHSNFFPINRNNHVYV